MQIVSIKNLLKMLVTYRYSLFISFYSFSFFQLFSVEDVQFFLKPVSFVTLVSAVFRADCVYKNLLKMLVTYVTVCTLVFYSFSLFQLFQWKDVFFF